MNDQNQFYYVKGTQVLTTGLPTPLIYTPDGWQDISIFFERNKKYFAIDRSFTLPLNFVEDGARIIKHLFYNQSVENQCYLVIAEQVLDYDGITYGFRYQRMYRGQIDFSTFQHVGAKVTVNVMEGDLVKLIKAYENTDFEIPLETADAIQIKMDGVSLVSSANYVTVDEVQAARNTALPYNIIWLQMQYVESDGKNINGIFNSTTPLTTVNSLGPYNDSSFPDNNFYEATADVSPRIVFPISMTLTNGQTLELYIKNSNGTRYSLHTITNPVPLATFIQTDIVNVDITIPMAAGEKLYLLSQVHVAPFSTLPGFGQYVNTQIGLKYKSKFQDSIIKAYPPLILIQKLLDKITKGRYKVTSSLLANNLNMITSGDGLRGFSGAVIKTSLLKIFKLFDLLEDAAMGIVNNKLVFEDKKYWYDETNIIDLGSVSNLKVTEATDYLFSTINIGYPNQNYNQALGDVNGKLEPNVTHTYTTGITCVQNDLDLTTDVRADMYGIEFTRINLENKTTTDASSDNDTFVIRCAPLPLPPAEQIYELDRSLNPYASIVIDPSYNMDAATQADIMAAFDIPSAFNLAITPKECLYKKGAFLHGCLRKMDQVFLEYQVSDKYALVKVSLPGGKVVYERANVQIGDLDAPYFADVQFDFETKTPINLQDILAQNPVQAFQFEYQGVIMQGVNIKVGMQPAIQKSQVWSLLSVPSNNLSQLIEVWI